MIKNIKDLDLPKYHPWFLQGDKNINELIDEGLELSKTNWIADSIFGYTIFHHKDTSAILKDARWHNAVKIFLNQNDDNLFKRNKVDALIVMEGEEHYRLRKLVAPYFTPKYTNKMRDYVFKTVSNMANNFSNTDVFDIEKEIFRKIPTYTICEMLGIPKEDADKFIHWSNRLFLNIGFIDEELKKELVGIANDFMDYVQNLINEKRLNLKDDLISDLIRAQDGDDSLSDDEISMLIRVILASGTDTGCGQLGLTFKALSSDLFTWKKISNNEEILKEHVAKCLILDGVIKQAGRIASEDIEYNGVLFPKGTIVFTSISIPNIQEPDSRPLTFGRGIHYCLGAAIAVVLVEETMSALANKFPNIKITDRVIYSTTPRTTNRADSMPVLTNYILDNNSFVDSFGWNIGA
jgi:cytochrome P450